ncbi:hypothetical protein MUK42_33122 [Musa troglodytarum]|uniref:Uncharacterized protein n=1 Tax=Musa troglodytarum TaxID=320322 RepID=A0A9E7EXR2_9LILI|nr:hypothetical protein MUK42_33122 [Musa troglodytarum]
MEDKRPLWPCITFVSESQCPPQMVTSAFAKVDECDMLPLLEKPLWALKLAQERGKRNRKLVHHSFENSWVREQKKPQQMEALNSIVAGTTHFR